MSGKIKFRPSLLLVLTRLAIAICVIGCFLFTFLGTVDLRTEQQIEQENRQELISHTLFNDAIEVFKLYRKNNKQTTILKVSCVTASKSGSLFKAALIEDANGTETCYLFPQTHKAWVFSPTNVYDYYSTQLKVTSKLVLEGDDLDILYEEAYN